MFGTFVVHGCITHKCNVPAGSQILFSVLFSFPNMDTATTQARLLSKNVVETFSFTPLEPVLVLFDIQNARYCFKFGH